MFLFSNVEPSGQDWGEENDGELPGYTLSRRRTCGVHGRNPKLLTSAFVCVCMCVCVCVCVCVGAEQQLNSVLARLIVEVCRSQKKLRTHTPGRTTLKEGSGSCFKKRQVLSWQVKILVRMTVVTGVCFTGRQVTSNW